MTKARLEQENTTLREQMARLEKQLAWQEQRVLALQESEERLHAVLNNLLDVPYQRNLRTDCYDYLSPVIEQLIGWTVEEMSNVDIETVLARIHPDDLPRVQQEIERTNALCRATGQATGLLEYRFLTKAGSYCWLGDNLTVIAGEDGQPLYRLGMIRDITERKRVEEELRQSEESFTKIFQANPAPMVISRLADGKILIINEAYTQLLGYEPSEVVDRRPAELNLYPQAERQEIVHRLQQQGVVRNYEMVLRAKSGERRDIIMAMELIRFNGEEGILTTLLDITERKQVEEALRQSEEKYAALFHKSVIPATLAKHPEGVYVDVNEAFEKTFGYSRQEFIGKTGLEVGVSTPEARSAAMAEFQQRGFLHENVQYVRTKSGEIRIVSINVNPVEFGGQKYVIMTIQDITERKRAEEEIRRQADQLREQAELLEQAHVLIRDMDNRVVYWNRGAEQLYGWTKEEAQGQVSHTFLQTQFPESLTVYERQLMQTGQWAGELTHTTKECEKITVASHHALHYDPTGQPVRILEVNNDITERKRVEEELRRSNAELEQFAYVASHDLQEPLRAVAGMMQLLQQRYQGRLDEYADEYIELAVEAANRMQALINDLLTYSRVGRRGKPFEPVNAGTCLQTALKNLEVAIAESQAVITHDDLPTVTADSTELTQLFQNLISNSLKFRSDQTPQIHISVVKVSDSWQFSVRDNGIGIEPQYFKRIFQVFQRLHTRDDYPGTGIGLALCQKIVERHGGAIWVESSRGQGSTFYFTLPLRSIINDNK